MGQLLEYEKQIKSSISQSLITKTSPPSNTSNFSNISKPIINSINSTCQTLCTITKTVSSNETGSKSLEINKPKLNLTATALKKPFIFNSPPGGASTTDQDLFKVILQPVFSRASNQQQPALLSPCKALENFNFNSPKVEKSVIELFESSIQSSSSSEDLNSNSTVKFRNIEQDKLKYMPKSFTISDNLSETTGTTNSFKLSLSRKTTTTNYKRTAERLNVIDVEQENCQDNDNDNNLMSSLSSAIENDKQQQKLTRPSSIFLNRQHLLPIKETNPNIQQLSSFFSSTTSSSSSSTSYLQQNNPNDSPQNNEFQFDLNNKKMRLSPITDINPIHSNSQLLLLQNSIKSKSSENLVKTVNDSFNISSSYNNENYSFHKSQSTNLNIETEAKSTF